MPQAADPREVAQLPTKSRSIESPAPQESRRGHSRPAEDGVLPPAPGASRAALTRAYVAAVVALASLGAVLRFFRLDFQSLYRDEGHTLVMSQASWEAIWRLGSEMQHPMLYFACVRLWTGLFGHTVADLRSLSALCGCGALLLLILLAGQLAGKRGALFAAALAAPSTFLIASAQEARPYAFFALLLLAFAVSRPQPLRWGLVALLATLLLYTDYLAAPLLLVAFVLLPRPARRPLMVAGILWLPCAFQLVHLTHTQEMHAQSLPMHETLIILLSTPAAMMTGAGTGPLARLAVNAIALVVAGLLIWRAPRRVQQYAAVFVVALFLSTVLIWKHGVGCSALSRSGMFAPFLPLILALAAAGRPGRLTPALLSVLVLIGGVDIARGYYTRPIIGGWKQMAEWLTANAEKRPVYAPPYQAAMLRYYYPPARDYPLSGTPPRPFLFSMDNDHFLKEGGLPVAKLHRFVNVLVAEVPD